MRSCGRPLLAQQALDRQQFIALRVGRSATFGTPCAETDLLC